MDLDLCPTMCKYARFLFIQISFVICQFIRFIVRPALSNPRIKISASSMHPEYFLRVLFFYYNLPLLNKQQPYASHLAIARGRLLKIGSTVLWSHNNALIVVCLEFWIHTPVFDIS